MQLANLIPADVWKLWNRLDPALQIVIVGTLALGALFAFYGIARLLFPKVMAIARTTAKEGWAHPLFWVELVFGAMLLWLFVFLPYNTFGEDVKMVKDTGLKLITLFTIGLSVFTASVTIADELEGRTALTLLSKPIGRRQFVFGKFLGVLAPAFSMFVILGVIFLEGVSYKVKYDARETSNPTPTAEQKRAEVVQVSPGLVLAFFETAVLTSIAIAISTRWPMLPNLMTCFAIYVLGHLAPLLVQSSVGQMPLVTFVGRLLATILPALEYFNADTSIAADITIPLEYLGHAFIYSAIYITIAMLAALLMFEDRDLA
ncbi:MAG TPA: ABC transporter permease subunit [Pirellulales bacterium]|nr:ABC transporter permease subunit [Pirellulales bacterium]